ncbi:MAG: damage-control phosphatase ARMT1 family protein [Anaerolineae bacterium]
MIPFDVPSPQIDLEKLPPPILTSEPGSFAQRTFAVRIPRIIQETLELNSFPDDIRAALEELRMEILDGRIRALREEAPDRRFWDEVSGPYLGRTWLDIPWYWGEAYMYRRILEATRYFQPGPWHGFDPYAAIKATEWAPDAAPRAVNLVLEESPTAPRARFERLLHASLWGNRTDLSYNVAAQVGKSRRHQDERSNLLIDDTRRVWDYLKQGPCARLCIITDNAGTELAMDMALVDFVLSENLASEVVLHLKPQPFFVSDAMPRDVEAGLEALREGGDAARALSDRLQRYIDNQRLRLSTHWLYATSLFYFQLPDDLHTELGGMGLVILKGDVNYRRLVGDMHWPPTTPFEEATAYFPAPLLSLRTMKAELILGLREGQAEELRKQDPAWMVNGQRGLIQGRLSG